MPALPITFACGLYDRMLALHTGDIKPDGIDLNFLVMDNPREIFDRMSNRLEFDACEMSSSEFITRYAAKKLPFVALPVFASRVFRHSFIIVNRKHIKSPADFAGKRVGVPLYTQTAAIFIRGLMQHDLGIDLDEIEWIQGAINEPGLYGNPSVMPMLKPANIKPNTSGKSLSDLLESGEIHAIVGSNMPKAFGRNPDVVRLIPDYRAQEKDYVRRTKIFPIMHLVVIRNDVYEQSPFVATSLTTRSTKRRTGRGKRCAIPERYVTCCRGCPTTCRRSTTCSAAIAGPMALSRTGRRWKRWSPIWSSRV
jgi:4,5-dihydroxyphthalate decarboxylase